MTALAASSPSQVFRIENAEVELAYDVLLPPTGNGIHLRSLVEKSTSDQFDLDAVSLWEIQLYDPATTAITTYKAEDATAFAQSLFPAAAPWSQFTAVWTGIGPGGGATVAVVAQAVPGEPTVQFSVGADTSLTGQSLYSINGPRIQFREGGPAGEGNLAVPYVGGVLVDDPFRSIPLTTAANPGIAHPGLYSMQWFSYYNPQDLGTGTKPKNLFWGARDNDGYRKDLITRYAPGDTYESFRFGCRQYPPDHLAATAWTVPYTFVLGFLRGDWYDAARFYRSWSTQQSWVPAPILMNADYSAKVEELEMWGDVIPGRCTFPGTPPTGCRQRPDRSTFSSYWLRDMVDQRSFLGVSKIGVLARDWHITMRGDWLPEATFRAALSTVTAAGITVANYGHNLDFHDGNLGLWSSHYPANSILFPTGPSLTPNVLDYYDEFPFCLSFVCQQSSNVSAACMGTTFPSTQAFAIGGAAAASGGSGFYLDEYTHQLPEICQSTMHSHGKANTADYHQATVDNIAILRNSMRTQPLAVGLPNPDIFSASTSPQERFLSTHEMFAEHLAYLDPSGQGIGTTTLVPMFETVYSEYYRSMTEARIQDPNYAALFGGFTRQWYAGRIFFGGIPWAGSVLQPTSLSAAMAASTDYAAFMNMLKSYMDILKQTSVRRTSVYGERRRDPAIGPHSVGGTLGSALLDSGASWIYPVYGPAQPYVYVSAYARPDLTEVGILLLNWTDPGDTTCTGSPCLVAPDGSGGPPPATGPQSFSFTVDPAEYGLPDGNYKVVQVTATGEVTVSTPTIVGQTPFTVDVTVPARDCQYFYVAPL